MKPILEAIRVDFTYPTSERKALDSLTLSIPAGSKTAICGHNGCGKSTLFLQSIGILRPQSGNMRWKEADLSYRKADLSQLRRRIGLVFQDPEQQLILNTPYEDISYGLRNAGLPEHEIKQRTEAVLVSMGLEHLRDTPIHHLSLGQKKRVTLAGVLVLEPELLLLDEPTAYLDRRSEAQLIQQLDRIHDQGVTIAMSTHDMNLAYAWADWMIVMDRGSVVLTGTPEEVFSQREQIVALGLELPLLYEVWQSFPNFWREGLSAPKDVDSLKAWIASQSDILYTMSSSK